MAESVMLMSKTIMTSPDTSIAYVGGGYIRFERGLHLPPRHVENHRFLYVESGSGEFIIPDETLQLDDRMLLLLSPGVREIRYDDKRPVSYTYIEFSVTRDLVTDPWLQVPESSPHFQTLIGLLHSTLHEDGHGTESVIRAAIDLALRHTAPTPDPSTPTVDGRRSNPASTRLHRPKPQPRAESKRTGRTRRPFRAAIPPRLSCEHVDWAKRVPSAHSHALRPLHP